MYHKTRICPSCGKEIQYKGQSSWSVAKLKNYSCMECGKKRMAQKHSIRYKGEGNPFYGKKHTPETKAIIAAVDKSYTQTDDFKQKTKDGMGDKFGKVGGHQYPFWVKLYGEEEALRRLEILRNKQRVNSTGQNNPMYGKPSPQGSGNGWKGWYNGVFFRSIRELMFRIEMEEQNKSFCTGESQKTKIQYVDALGQTRNYFPDFIVEQKHIVEVKPKRLWNTPNITAKRLAAEQWCSVRNMDYSLYDPKIDVDKIKQLWESKKVEWAKGYEQKFVDFMNGVKK